MRKISRESAEPIRRLRRDRRVEIEGDPNTFREERLRSRLKAIRCGVHLPQVRVCRPP